MAAPPISERHLHHFHRRSPIKETVRCATTGSVTIATALNAGDTIDGVTLAAGDRVLVKDNGDATNGVYVVSASPARDYDVSTDDPDLRGALIYVREGTANGGRIYRCTNTAVPTIGTTTLTFGEFTGGNDVHVADTTDAHDASAISIADAGDFFTATEVEAALAELGGAIYNPGIIRTSDGTPAAAGLTMSNANQACYSRWRGTGTITKIGIEVVVSSGNIQAAVYAPTAGTGLNDGLGRDAEPGARKATTGDIACPAVGFRELDLGGSVVIEPGDWFAFSADNVSAYFLMTEDAGSGLVTNVFKGLRYYKSSYTLSDPANPEAAGLLRIPFAIGVP